MLDFGTDTPKLRLILSGFRGQLAPFITVHSPDSTKSGRCPYLAAKFAGTPRFMGPIRAIEVDRGRKGYLFEDFTLLFVPGSGSNSIKMLQDAGSSKTQEPKRCRVL